MKNVLAEARSPKAPFLPVLFGWNLPLVLGVTAALVMPHLVLEGIVSIASVQGLNLALVSGGLGAASSYTSCSSADAREAVAAG